MHAIPLRLLLPLSFLCFGSTLQATIISFAATLDGPSESPPVASPGTGTALVVHDSVAHTLSMQIDFTGLVGDTTVAHIHAPTALPFAGTVGVATYPGTFPGFPAGVTSGNYFGIIDLSLTGSFTATFLTLGGGTAAGAEALLLASILDGKAYVNVHSTFAPGGEIRGFLVSVPDTASTASLLGLFLLALLGLRRRLAA